MQRLRQAIDRRVADLTGRRQSPIDYLTPAGDPGLFGPDSAVWRVHGDFTSMLCGGIGALLLQMLHPAALAGVWDHSSFRSDMLGRLRRTSQFIAVTTYAGQAEAETAIARVRSIHSRVSGSTADGTPYQADDPELLTWVHVAEMSRFLAGYLRFVDPHYAQAEQDRYYRESARIAHALGATQVPQSVSEINDYLQEMRPSLRCDERTREVTRLLLAAGPKDALGRRATRLFMRAGIGLLPDWAIHQLGLYKHKRYPGVTRGSIQIVAPIIRHSVTGTACEKAHQRVGAAYR